MASTEGGDQKRLPLSLNGANVALPDEVSGANLSEFPKDFMNDFAVGYQCCAGNSATLTCPVRFRCIAISKPLSHRMSRKCALIIIALIWFVSVVIALPSYVFAQANSYQNDRVVCAVYYPSMGSFSSEDVDFM